MSLFWRICAVVGFLVLWCAFAAFLAWTLHWLVYRQEEFEAAEDFARWQRQMDEVLG